MRKMKKAAALALTMAMSVSVLAGCSGGSSGSTAATTAAAAAETAADSGSEETTAAASDTSASVAEKLASGAKVGSGVHGGSGYVADNVQRDVVKIAAPAMPTTMSPWAGTATGRHMTMYEVYQPLFEQDKSTGDYVLVLADNIEKLDDTHYRVTVRQGVVDSEGNPFTAADAVFSINMAVSLGNLSGMQYVGAVELVDDYTLDIEIKSVADYQFPSSIAMIMMTTQAAYEASEDEMAASPVGTGPYKVVEFESGSVVTLEKVDDYWGADLNDRENNDAWYYFAQNVDRIEYLKVAEASQQSIALETGEVQAAYRMSGDEAGRLEDTFNVWSTMDSQSYNMFFNCGDLSPMSNQQLRQAVCYAIDNPGVMTFTGGYGLLSTTFGSAIFADCNDEWANEDYYDYDPDKAMELIKESGFDTTTPIRLMVSTSSTETTSIAQVVQSYLMAVGLNVQIDQYDSAAFASSKYDETMYDIRLDNASMACLADLWTQYLGIGDMEKSYAQIADQDLEDLLVVLATEEGRSVENVNAAHYYIKDKAYAYGLYCRQLFDTTSTDIVEFTYMPKLYAMPGGFTYQ